MKHVAFTLALCAALHASPAAATSVRALSLAELVDASSLIVHARAVAVTDRVHRVRGVLEPRTTTRFVVIESLRGHAREVTVEANVGAMGEGRTRGILGLPRFAAGEEALLFLRNDHGALAPVGLGQGVFRVQRTGRERPVCLRTLAELEVVGDTAIPDRLPLADLRAAVLALGGPR